ncbi:universal stress protein [Piscinibacter gummiphilus]|uniref:Universal stress protein n=1 Tax=Piscinibacter gummiphilus TaxID=946333 RepID=A0ABZ0D058_9BURK|nr:universal stress protein [Piscinibacter gummiphilus]WOB10630.1 universal stress protein [Piscinibacter gummiphilus]
MYTHILVPLDGSKTAEAGLREALALAHDQGAAVRVLHVLDPSAAAVDMLTAAECSSVLDALHEQGKALLARVSRRARRRGIPCDTVLRERGEEGVAGVILDEAAQWDCDLVVMGTHGRRGLPHMLGSTAQAVLRHTPVPVLLVRSQR